MQLLNDFATNFLSGCLGKFINILFPRAWLWGGRGGGGGCLLAWWRVKVKILSNNECKIPSLIDSNLKAMVKIAFFIEMQNFTLIDKLHFVLLLC